MAGKVGGGFLSAMDLATFQFEKLSGLLGFLAADNPFYKEKLKGDWEVGSLAEFSGRVPFTTKLELAADRVLFSPYGSNLSRPLEEYTRFHQTSGTSGQPMIWLDDASGWRWICESWAWVWREAGVRAGEAAFFPFSFGPFLGFWAGYESAASVGLRVIPGGGLSSEQRLRMMERLRPEILCCTPTYGLRLAQVAEGLGMRAGDLGVGMILVAGEPGGSLPAVRESLEKAWGATVVDHHGMTEVGPVTVSGSGDWLKINHRAYFCEVIDPVTGDAAEFGEVGELVLTTLGREASPLIRYRTGDLVLAEMVEGEEGFVLKGGILGRADDMVVVRGVNLYPGAVEEVVRSVAGIGEYRVTVSERNALSEVSVEAEGSAAAAVELAKALRNAFSLRIPVVAVEPGSLPIFEVKAKRWVG